jgi:RNA polymerase sigma factor (sigma-70 family)
MDLHAGESCSPAHWNVETRESLIRRIRDWNDDVSWQEFFDLYWGMIHALAVRSGLNEAEAQDVVQATMVAVADNVRRFDDSRVGSFKNWLLHQARWKISDHLRRRRREDQHLARDSRGGTVRSDTLARIPDHRDPINALIERDWDDAVSTAALKQIKAKVKPKHFQMFDLYAIKKWPIQQVSETLHVNVSQVYLAKSRITRLLKKQLPLVEAQLMRSFRDGGTSKSNP